MLLLGGIARCKTVLRRSQRILPQVPSIFKPESTPADSIFHLSLLVLASYRPNFSNCLQLARIFHCQVPQACGDDGREPPQVYGSNQVELAWTVIPVLVVLVLFLATARVIHSIQDAPEPAGKQSKSPPSAISSGGSFDIRAWALSLQMNSMFQSAIPLIPHRRFLLCCPRTRTTASGFRD